MSDKSGKATIPLALLAAMITAWISCMAFNSQMLYAAVGVTALTIVAVPMFVQERIDWFSPWTFVVLSVAIGCAARGICMSFGWPDEYDIDYFFLLGEDPHFFFLPLMYLLLGLGCLTAGYFSFTFPNVRLGWLSGRLRWNVLRMRAVLTVAVLLSLVATAQYIRNTGGFSSDVISAKRTVVFDIDIRGDDEFNQYGYLRQMAKLANFAYLTLLGYSLYYVRAFSPLRLAVLGGLLIVACALPFYSSSRLPIMWTFFGSVALLWYSGRRISLGHLASVSCVALVVFYGMTAIRGKREATHLRENSLVESIVDAAVIHRNFLGISKTAHVINSIPSVLDYQYGKTIAVWSLSPIPRKLWKNKPMIHSGPLIGSKVYGNNVSGVPPGMFAELFWNFQLPGIVCGAFALGIGLRFVAEVFRPKQGGNLPLTLVYVIGPMRLGFEMAGNSIGFGLMKVLVDAASMAILLFLVLDRQMVLKVRSRPGALPLRRAA